MQQVSQALPTYLAETNPHPRDSKITFEEGPHIYTIEGNEDTTFTSVTTWVHSYFKKFDAKKVIEGMMRNKRKWEDPIANAKYYGKTAEEIEEMWKIAGAEASAKGTAMHYEIECFYNTPYTAPDTAPDTAQSSEFEYFLKFNKEFSETLKPYRTEWMVFHEEAQIAGSIDMVYENVTPATTPATTYSIYDWKRCKEITKTSSFGEFATNPIIEHLPDTNFWHYALQLNIYKYILTNKYNKTITDLYLIVLHPEAKNKSYQRIKLPDLQVEVGELFSERIEHIKNKENKVN
jgi:hypothetical protein